MRKACKNCSKPNLFAKMCRSNQVNEIGEDKPSSEKECNLIQSFNSYDEFEIMMVEPRAERPLKKGVGQMKSKINEEKSSTTQVIKRSDIRRDPRSHQKKKH